MNQDKGAHGRSPGAAQQTAPKGKLRAAQKQPTPNCSKAAWKQPNSSCLAQKHSHNAKKGHPIHLGLRAFATRKNSKKDFQLCELTFDHGDNLCCRTLNPKP